MGFIMYRRAGAPSVPWSAPSRDAIDGPGLAKRATGVERVTDTILSKKLSGLPSA
jgi:hypothetical protein